MGYCSRAEYLEFMRQAPELERMLARVEAMRHVPQRFPYANKDVELVGTPDPLVVGAAAGLFEADEQPTRTFPQL
jgi:hypothetical protein